MRVSLWCVWILTLHTAAQHPPEREDGGVQPGGGRRQSPGRPTAPRPAAVRGAGERTGGRRAPLTGPHVCGGRCCVGWILSPRTKRCTKHRCFPRCSNGGLCRPSNRCVCRRGFHGRRCEVSTAALTSSVRPGVLIPQRGPPTFTSYRDSGPPQRHANRKTRVLTARSGPAAMVTPPASTTTSKHLNTQEDAMVPDSGPASMVTPPASTTTSDKSKPETRDTQEVAKGPDSGPIVMVTPPASMATSIKSKIETQNTLEDAKVPDSSPHKSGQIEDRRDVSKEALMKEENQAFPKRPQMTGRRAERTQTLNNRTGDAEEDGAAVGLKDFKTDTLKSEGEKDEASQSFGTTKSLSSSHSEGQTSVHLKEMSKPEDKRSIRQSDSETSSKMSKEEEESDAGRKEEKQDEGVTAEKTKKKEDEEDEEVKTGTGNKQSLRTRISSVGAVQIHLSSSDCVTRY